MKKLLILILLLLITLFIVTIIYNQESIIHPKRRELQGYHYEWLNYPYKHSMKIIKDKEHKDILIVKFDDTVSCSKRSKKILDELEKSGYKKESLSDNGVMVMFHGKNGRKEDLLPVAERYVSAGFTCVLVDLPAHGDSVKTETEYNEKLDYMALNVAKKYVDIYNQPIYFWGMSLGGRYAITSSSTYKKKGFLTPKALVLVSTFDNFSNVLKDKSNDLFGSYVGDLLYQGLRFSLNLFYNFDPQKINSATLAQGIKVPVFMLHGKKDKLIDYRAGVNLFEEFPNSDKEFYIDEKGNHHNILVTSYPFYLKSILFLLKHK